MILAIGANLPAEDGTSPRQTCERVLRAIAATDGVSDVVRSRWFFSAPVPPSSQPCYVNGAIALRTSLAPAALLRILQAIERQAGRTRGEANGPRTLDLDIIDMAGQVRAAPDPILPHERAHLRAFVLLPLRDVAPRWVHPVSGLSVQALLDALPPQDVAPC